jgi:Putative peptidoglycan binding domain
MFKPTVSRRGIARTLSTLLALTLTVGVGGLSANGAAATVALEIPLNVTAEATTALDGVGVVVVNWDAPVDPDSIFRVDVDLDGQDQRRVHSDRRDGVVFSGIAPGNYTASVAFEYTDSSPDSDPVTVGVTVEALPPAPGAPTNLRASPVTKGGRTRITWTAPVVGGPVEFYILSVDGRVTVASGSKTKRKVKGLRAGPAKVKMLAVTEAGFSKTAHMKFHVAKSVAQAPKPTLQLGMKGPAVLRLQTNLGMRHANGTFGKSTRHAVLQFQRWTGRERTGVCDDRMRYLLNV